MYEWYACYCRECLKMDLSDRNKYDNNEAYCTERKHYYNTNDRACFTYFIYDENRNQNSSGCYITTIVCDILKYSDNCNCLNVLRQFRDYMLTKPSLMSILYEYDVIGPIIAKNILNDQNKEQIATHLYNNYISVVVRLIENKNYDLAIKKYTEMVNLLKKLYNVDITLNVEEEKVTGKGYLKKIT